MNTGIILYEIHPEYELEEKLTINLHAMHTAYNMSVPKQLDLPTLIMIFLYPSY